MSDEQEIKSPWKLIIDEKGFRRVRDTSQKTGVPSLPLEAPLRNLIVGIGGIVEMTGDTFSANAVHSKAEELAYGWAAVAKENERVRIALKWMLEANAWTEALVPTALLGGAIAWHHGLLPDQIGEGIAKISGLEPMTREEELELRQRLEAQMQAQREREAEQQAQAERESQTQAQESGHTRPEPEETEGSNITPIPPNALDND